MDEEKKQKVMIGVLAALVLGAGAYFFAFRDTGGPTKQAIKTGPVVRRTPKKAATAAPKRRARRTRAKADAKQVTRRKATPKARSKVTRRKRGRRGPRTIKKKKILPMG